MVIIINQFSHIDIKVRSRALMGQMPLFLAQIAPQLVHFARIILQHLVFYHAKSLIIIRIFINYIQKARPFNLNHITSFLRPAPFNPSLPSKEFQVSKHFFFVHFAYHKLFPLRISLIHLNYSFLYNIYGQTILIILIEFMLSFFIYDFSWRIQLFLDNEHRLLLCFLAEILENAGEHFDIVLVYIVKNFVSELI